MRELSNEEMKGVSGGSDSCYANGMEYSPGAVNDYGPAGQTGGLYRCTDGIWWSLSSGASILFA